MPGWTQLRHVVLVSARYGKDSKHDPLKRPPSGTELSALSPETHSHTLLDILEILTDHFAQLKINLTPIYPTTLLSRQQSTHTFTSLAQDPPARKRTNITPHLAPSPQSPRYNYLRTPPAPRQHT